MANTRFPLDRLLANGESEAVEFKEGFDEEALETVAAFANMQGGVLLIGISDDGVPTGISLGKETLRDWTNRIAQATHIHPNLQRVKKGGKTVVVIQVDESAVKPVPCRGRYYKRVGKSNRQMSDDDLTRTVLDKVGMTWDQGLEPRATLDDLDPIQLLRFRKLCNIKGRRIIPEEEQDQTVLEKLGLLSEGRPRRSAVLLFGREPQRFYPSAFVKIGRFRSPALIVDDREVTGSLMEQIDGAMGYFREHLQTRFEFTGEVAREVIWEYPLEALREAITNAICHRDYLDFGSTQVRWYDQEITLLNPGGLPPPLRLEELKGPHRSIPRNRQIAEMFYFIGWIERWGSGIYKILSECTAAGLPEPDFEEKQSALWVTFRKDTLQAEHLSELGLNERQIKAVIFVKEKGSITNRQYRDTLSVSNKTAYMELDEMAKKGILIREGAGRSLRYSQRK
jgi:ATP-dependent DNA helicase RecG